MANQTKRSPAPNPARSAPARTSAPRTSKANLAYEQIRSLIVDGEYPPGTRLVLDRLARELDMSTLPVREAIRRLEAEGYVQFRQNVGATVLALDAESFVQALETFAVLESAATAQAVRHLSADDLAAARKLNQAMATALDNLDRVRYAALHDEFHALIASRCPNAHLVRVLTNERQRLQRVRVATLALGAAGRREVEEHDHLLAMVEAGASEEEVEALSRAHLAAVTSMLGQ